MTETDQAVEKYVKDAISQAYPDHSFIGEESHAAGEVVQFTDAPTWICDPIDGTVSFQHCVDAVTGETSILERLRADRSSFLC